MHCLICGFELKKDDDKCPNCGRIVEDSTIGFLQEEVESSPDKTSFKTIDEILPVELISNSELFKSKVYWFLLAISTIPLIVFYFGNINLILYGIIIYASLLWAGLLYRIFSDKDQNILFSILVFLFTCFIGFSLLKFFLKFTSHITDGIIKSDSFFLKLSGNIFVIGLREELTKIIPVIILATIFKKIKKPLDGLVYGMMSGIGYAAAENVFYVYKTIEVAQQNQSNLILPVINNIIRIASVTFVHICFSGIFGYFIGLSKLQKKRWLKLFLLGLLLSSILHGIFNTLIEINIIFAILISALTFTILMAYVLKSRGIFSAREMAKGLFRRTSTMPSIIVNSNQAKQLNHCKLTIFESSGSVKYYDLINDETTIGREDNCHIVVSDPYISKVHIILKKTPKGFKAINLSKTNKMYINDKICKEKLLNTKDEIKIGKTRLEYNE